jgi:hypothetical protein
MHGMKYGGGDLTHYLRIDLTMVTVGRQVVQEWLLLHLWSYLWYIQKSVFTGVMEPHSPNIETFPRKSGSTVSLPARGRVTLGPEDHPLPPAESDPFPVNLTLERAFPSRLGLE